MLYLASTSPRRKELLQQVNFSFSVCETGYEEKNSEMILPEKLVVTQALGKAKAANITWHDNVVVLGADTIVVCNGSALGKPKDRKDAKEMLHLLSGNTHEVITGVALCHLEWEDSFYVTTKVTFRQLYEEDMEQYLSTEEPYDKAGAYAIQGMGALWVDKIEGSYTNVVGLPVEEVYKRLQVWGVKPW